MDTPPVAQRTGSRRGIIFVLLLVFVIPILTGAFFFIGARYFGFGSISGTELISVAEAPAAMAATSDGGLIYGERTTGRVFSVSPSGVRSQSLFEVPVRSDGQRGLLGLAIGEDRNIFVSWVEPGGRLLVGVAGTEPDASVRVVWRGPETAELGNGGHLAFSPDGELAIGIGDLQEPDLIDEPSVANGKLLLLDPDGEPEQEPEVLSGGWHNPFAFDFTPSGDLWVADNAPGDKPERLMRGDGVDAPSTELDRGSAPSGLAAVDDTTLVVCGFVSNEMAVYRVDTAGRAYTSRAQPTLATDCSVGAVLLSDGRIAYASEDSIRIAEAP